MSEMPIKKSFQLYLDRCWIPFHLNLWSLQRAHIMI